MNAYLLLPRILYSLIVLPAALAGASGRAVEPLRTQILVLKQGWNSVFLEVQPVDSKPEIVFANQPV